jgi:pimeloyl-ACP methyl ester carboxylesterase
MSETATPVVFIHGLWLHSSSWQPWVDLFNENGYDASAPGWPGDGDTVEETRAHPDAVANFGVDEVAEHYATYISKLPAKPIVIGHSFGGLLVERLLGDDHAAAGVALDAAPIKGVLPLPISALRVAFVALRNPGNIDAAISLTKEQFHYGFGNGIGEDESGELFDAWTIPSPARPLFQAAGCQFQPPRRDQSRHSEHRPWTAAAQHGRLGPHRAGGDQQVDVQEVPALRGHDRARRVRRPRALPDHRPRLA